MNTRRSFLIVAVASVMIAANWTLFIWSVQTGQTTQTSLGYYVYPLVAVLIGAAQTILHVLTVVQFILMLLDKGKPIYNRKLGVAEVMARIERYYQPYHDALWELMANAHTRFGVVYHINCHSMRAVAGKPRAAVAPRMMAKELVIWDCDGVLVDSEALLKTAEVEALPLAEATYLRAGAPGGGP